MKGKKSFVFLLAVLLVISLAACGGSSGGDATAPPADDSSALIVVGFSQVGAESDWRTANTQSMKDTFVEANGYKLIFDDAQQKQENQITAIRNFIQQEVDYIVLAPVTETGWDTVLQEAKDAGIPVIIVDRMIDVSDDSLYTAWVGSDFRKEGDKAAAWIVDNFKDKEVNIVHIQGTIGSSAQIGRTAGLEDAVAKNSNLKIIAQQSGEFTQAKGQEVMESVLKQNDKIDVVYCENDNEAFGVIDALEAAGKTYGKDGDIKIISFDATNAGLTDTLSGKINYNVECNPLHGPRVEKIIKQLEGGQTPDKKAYVDEAAFDANTITQADIDARAY
ncbi:ABC transporter substrate-binding protein [Anoxybacterium hadale]|uniref:ABC transporter substrate-binding protein n=1 Tax=Anoxybacterium hadale TaxID=3408580 RepID=A0ACD1AGX0_9FIRM|nr:ABC transporter substrate-binding protein [Clostridiales bacterium]